MLNSSERIITTHAGSLPRPDTLPPLIQARARGDNYDKAALDKLLSESVDEVVRLQIENGIDSVNDGELSKTNFTQLRPRAPRRLRTAPPEARRDRRRHEHLGARHQGLS